MTKIERKPEWLLKKIGFKQKKDVEQKLKGIGVHTVCQEAMCPNISECFSNNNATFMILGDICTRRCTYCNVNKGRPIGLDENEPKKVADAVIALGLRHVVITSVTRDDLRNGGAEQFVKCVKAIKEMDESITVELLIPDLKNNKEALEVVANSQAEIIGHNIETVPRLYEIRAGATYKRSLEVLKTLKVLNSNIKTKSAIMLGLGESEEELKTVLKDLLHVGCTLLTLGQYLRPSHEHTKVVEYVTPQKFTEYGNMAKEMGFEFVKSSPYTRSSYMAHEYFENKQ